MKINLRGTLVAMTIGSECILTDVKSNTLRNTCSLLKNDLGMGFTANKIGDQTYKVIRYA